MEADAPAGANRKVRARSEKNANGQGTIYWSVGRNRWVAQVYDVTQRRRTKFFHLKKDAQAWLGDQIRLRESGSISHSTNPRATVSEFVQGYISRQAESGRIVEETIRNYQQALNNHISPAFGKVRADKLSGEAVSALLNSLLKKGYSYGMRQTVFALLRASYRSGVKRQLVPSNPINHVDAPHGQSTPTRHIPNRDFEKIYHAATLNPWMHARVEVGMMIGLRPGEVRGLKWSDINWDESTMTVSRQLQGIKGEGYSFRPTKTAKKNQEHLIPLTAQTREILYNHFLFQREEKVAWVKDHDLIFPNKQGGPLDAKIDRRWWRELLESAGAPYYQLYQMRKTAFTHLANLGTPLPTLIALTGHANASTVMKHYAFATDEATRKALAGMDRIRPVTTVVEIGEDHRYGG